MQLKQLKNIAIILWIILVIFAGSVLCISLQKAYRNQKQLETIEKLTAEREILKTQLALKRDEQSVRRTGRSKQRVANDQAILEVLLTDIIHWDGADDYSRHRSNIISKYGLHSRNKFLLVFLPSVLNDSTGDVSYFEKEGAYLRSVTLYPSDISGDIYKYSAVVDWSYYNADGRRLQQKSLLSFKTDQDGNIAILDAYVVPY